MAIIFWFFEHQFIQFRRFRNSSTSFFFVNNNWSDFSSDDSSGWRFDNIGLGGDDLLLGEALEHLMLRDLIHLSDFSLGLGLHKGSLGLGLHKVNVSGLSSGGNSSLVNA